MKFRQEQQEQQHHKNETKTTKKKMCVLKKKPEMKITKTKFLTFLFLNSWNCDTLKMSVCPFICLFVVGSIVCLSVCPSGSFYLIRLEKQLYFIPFHSIQFIHTSTNRQTSVSSCQCYIFIQRVFVFLIFYHHHFFFLLFCVTTRMSVYTILFYIVFFFNQYFFSF